VSGFMFWYPNVNFGVVRQETIWRMNGWAAWKNNNTLLLRCSLNAEHGVKLLISHQLLQQLSSLSLLIFPF
jgi:hypothetical protein